MEEIISTLVNVFCLLKAYSIANWKLEQAKTTMFYNLALYLLMEIYASQFGPLADSINTSAV